MSPGRSIRMLVLDVDGVLTDGRFLMRDRGGEWKCFDSRDGLGLRLLINVGDVRVVLLTGRPSAAVRRRAEELGLAEVVEGRRNKGEALRDLCARMSVPVEQCAYMGDDLVDLPAIRAAGLGAAPADARPEVRDAADWVAASPGGRGAVRELCEHLLKERGLWEACLERFR